MSTQRLPLTAPDTGAPAPGKLPVSDDRALALATVGFRAEAQMSRSTKLSGSEAAGSPPRLSWFIDGGIAGTVAQAAAMVEAQRHGKLATDHPYCAALAGIQSLRALMAWAAGEPVLPEARGKLRVLTVCRKARMDLVPAAELFSSAHLVWFAAGDVPEAEAARADAQAAVICAAIVCGLPVWPVLIGHPNGCPAVKIAPASLTFPGLTFLMLVEALARTGSTLPGYLPEEHPAHYAAGAVRNVRGLLAEQSRAARNPVLQIRGVNGRGAAFVSASLLDGGKADFRDQVRRHLLKP